MAIELNGTTGITTPGLINTGSETVVNLTTSGNTILGDASTDTLNVGNGGLVKDASGNVGIGTASPSGKLQVLGPNGSAENEYRSFTVSGSSGNKTVNIAYDAVNDVGVIAAADAGVNWKSLAICPVGGKVGINLSVPDSTLTVNGQFSVGAAPSGRRLYMGQNGTNAYIQALSSTSTAEGLAFFNGGTQTMTLNSSGNLGLGVTPSAWGSNGSLQINGSIASNSSTLVLYANGYYSGGAGDKYITSSTASRYYQLAGAHVWDTAPSGTAGGTITYTQAMTLNAGGNLGIGTTSPAGKLDVAGTVAISPGNAVAVIRRTTVNGSYGVSIQGNTNDTINNTNPGASVYVGGGPITGDSYAGRIDMTAYGNLTDSTSNIITFNRRTGVNTTAESMRITSIGTVVRSPQYSGNFSAGYTTVVDLTTIGAGLIIFGYGNENGVANTSTGIWLATASSGAGTYTLLLVSQATAGNAYGRLDMQMSGNNLQVKNGIGALGAYRLVFTAIA